MWQKRFLPKKSLVGMIEFALIGYPLEHSRSAEFFNNKFASLGMKATYFNHPVSKIEDLPAFIAAHPSLAGFNVTSPYKEGVLHYVSECDESALKVGAANLITVESNVLKAYNTDVLGFAEMVKPYLKAHHTRALILGTGGAAKAVAQAFSLLGLSFKFVSRFPAYKDEKVISYREINSSIVKEFSVVVNATPVGMFPNVLEIPRLPYEGITPLHLCCDLIYEPKETFFLRRCRDQGAMAINGLTMLYAQANRNWIIWEGHLKRLGLL